MHSPFHLPSGAEGRTCLGLSEQGNRTTGVAQRQAGVGSRPGCKVPGLTEELTQEVVGNNCCSDSIGGYRSAGALLQETAHRADDYTSRHMALALGVSPHLILTHGRQLGNTPWAPAQSWLTRPVSLFLGLLTLVSLGKLVSRISYSCGG